MYIMKEKFVCVHCHFYQPPRENPWLEAIEVQDLAAPFHDWNERINSECYAPNGASRILNNEGKIIDIKNNYESINFNFGPTLLSWIEVKDPSTYKKILEGDRKSMERFSGHGNAIAQVYNHIIMPLAEHKDKVTQVKWGLEDFKSRFKRYPEGMWLAETAVNTETLEVLADHDIRYTILSPYQAKGIRHLHNEHGNWDDVNHGKIDPSRAYLYKLSNGKTINLFFYDGHISQAVAFDQLLKDGSNFSKRLMTGYADHREHHQLLNIGTDGETYGHHFKFGEMALTFALKDLQEKHHIRLTNYAEFMVIHPPEYEVQIHENSSWSCSHGVERWKSDCGCSIGYFGEWNQKWRSPLRNSLNSLKKRLNEIFEEQTKDYFLDCWDARNGYIHVLLNRNPDTVRQFFEQYQKRELSHTERLSCLKLMEMQRQGMLMFTSCGWFFDDISGIETVQILKHACRAIQLAFQMGYDLEGDFVEELSHAVSNIPKNGNGKDIYYKLVKPSEVDLKRAIAHHAITSLLEEEVNNERSIYSFKITQEHYDKITHRHSSIAIGQVKVSSETTLDTEEAIFIALHLGHHDFQCKITGLLGLNEYSKMKNDLLTTFEKESLTQVVRKIDYYFPGDYYSLKELFVQERREVLDAVSRDIFLDFEQAYLNLYNDNKRLMQFHLEMDAPIHKDFQNAARFVLIQQLEDLIDEEYKRKSTLDYQPEITEVIQEAKGWYLELDYQNVEKKLKSYIFESFEEYKNTGSEQNIQDAIRLLKVAVEQKIPLNMWPFQNKLYSLKTEGRFEGKAEILRELESLLGFA